MRKLGTRQIVGWSYTPRKSAFARFAPKALLFIAVYLIIFSIAQYISFLITGVEQVQLIESTFTVFGIECGGLLMKRIIEVAVDSIKARWDKRKKPLSTEADEYEEG